MKTDITSRADIEQLVVTFYSIIRKDAVLGDIFNNAISDWDHHIPKIVDFWETNLFFKPVYKGKPIKKHIELDADNHHSLEEAHFKHWVAIWQDTVNELFKGEKAELAKYRAGNIANMMYIKVVGSRK